MQEKPKPKILLTTEDILKDFHTRLKREKRNLASTTGIYITTVLGQFRRWLTSSAPTTKPLSPKTIKNYCSDVRLFLQSRAQLSQDSISKNPQGSELLPQSSEDLLDYLEKIAEKGIKTASINRKRASLKQFALFLHELYAIPDWSQEIVNLPQDPIESILRNFKGHLKKGKHRPKTIKNYVTDIRHYLEWAQTMSRK